MIVLLFVGLFALLLSGAPVAVALAGSAMAWLLLTGQAPQLVTVQRMVSGVDSFPLLAIPFFVLAGSLMNTAGITTRIFDFTAALVGWMRGGLGHVNIGASVIFAGMSGAAVADAGGLGTIEIRAMRERGYDADFAVGITAASSTIGPIIPPSLPLVVYGVLASVSIGQLFIAGLVPGFVMALALMVMVRWMAGRRGYGADAALSLTRIWTTFRAAFLSLMTPVIIVGGILLGLFTPTEAAVCAVGWALALGFLVYRTLTLRRLLSVVLETIETTAVLMLIVAAAALFAWVITINQVPREVAQLLLSITAEPWQVLILINIVLLVAGLFLEPVAAITILVPVFLPIATTIGVDPVHFGIIMILNLMIGLLTPPVGMVLFVLSRVSGLSAEACAKATLPFLVPLIVSLALVTFVPALSLWLPTLVYR